MTIFNHHIGWFSIIIFQIYSSKRYQQPLQVEKIISIHPRLIVKSVAIIHNFSYAPISETAGIKCNSITYDVVFVSVFQGIFDKIFCQVMRVFFQIKFFSGIFQRTFLYFHNKATIKSVFALSFLQIQPNIHLDSMLAPARRLHFWKIFFINKPYFIIFCINFLNAFRFSKIMLFFVKVIFKKQLKHMVSSGFVRSK